MPIASDAAAFRGPAAIVGNGSDVANRSDLKAYGRECTNSRLTAGSRAFHEYFHATQTEIVGFFAGCRSCNLCGIGRVLATALETHFARAGPGNRVPVLIRKRDLHVVECSFDVSLSIGLNNHILLACASSAPLSFSHGVLGWLNGPTNLVGNENYLRGAAFLPATVFFLPLRVRAFVCVR